MITDFRGRAKRLDDVDLPRIGHEIGVGEDVIHAILEVESRGFGFRDDGRPVILFEPLQFYRQLKGDPDAQQRAIRAGLASRTWSRKTYNKDQYALLKRAMQINHDAALRATSWGLGQVMGFNYALAGWPDVESFVKAMMDDEENHLLAMINFIKSARLDDELRTLEHATTQNAKLAAAGDFARGYNGPGYKQNKYDTRIVAALDKWRKIPDTPWSPSDAIAEDNAARDEHVLDEMEEDLRKIPLPASDEPVNKRTLCEWIRGLFRG